MPQIHVYANCDGKCPLSYKDMSSGEISGIPTRAKARTKNIRDNAVCLVIADKLGPFSTCDWARA